MITTQILTRHFALLARGSVCTTRSSFSISGAGGAVDQTLSRLVRRGVLQRVGRGSLPLPEAQSTSKVPWLRRRMRVARAYARKTAAGFRCRGQAANELGLRTQVAGRGRRS